MTIQAPFDDAEPTSHERVFRVYQAVEELGPGIHPMWRIIESTKYTKSTVHRILTAGVRADAFVHPKQGHYGLTRGRLATPTEGLSDSTVMDDGVLYRGVGQQHQGHAVAVVRLLEPLGEIGPEVLRVQR
ncbi:hypothetical protein AB0K44_38140, partial [Streptomyces chartreusis]